MVFVTEEDQERAAHVVAQKYLSERGFNYWEFTHKMGDLVEVLSHQDTLKRIGIKEPKYARSGVYYLWFNYPGTSYGSGRRLNGSSKLSKMLCPEGVSPPLFVHQDLTPQEDVYFCESVLKACRMVEEGFCAFGGNGVNGIATNAGLPDNFPGHIMEDATRALILFDSDITTNKKVQLAGQKLALELTTRWPHLEIIKKTLPPPDLGDQEHWGLDDYCHYHGGELFAEWVRGPEDESPFPLGQRGKHLLGLAEQYAVCKSPVGIVCYASGELYKTSDFKGTIAANRTFTYTPEGGKPRKMYAAAEYIEWKDRIEVDACRYRPDLEPGIQGSLYNKWRDDGVVPVEGDITPFMEVYRNAIPRHEDFDLLMDLMAWGLQNRGQRWEKVLAFISVQQSTGKSTLLRIIRELYGPTNAVSVDGDRLGETFTGLWAEKEVVGIDDLMKMDAKVYSKVKRLVTDDMLDVNVKFGGQYTATNYANIILTSNDPGCIPLEDAERRLFALEFSPVVWHPAGETAYWNTFNDWLDGGGTAAIRYWLMHKDISTFDHRFMPPMNPIKLQMIESGKSDLATWVSDLKAAPGAMMGSTERWAVTPEEMLDLYLMANPCTEGQRNSRKNQLTQALNKAGFKKVGPVSFAKDTLYPGAPKKQLRFWNVGGPGEPTAEEARENFLTNRTILVTGLHGDKLGL